MDVGGGIDRNERVDLNYTNLRQRSFKAGKIRTPSTAQHTVTNPHLQRFHKLHIDPWPGLRWRGFRAHETTGLGRRHSLTRAQGNAGEHKCNTGYHGSLFFTNTSARIVLSDPSV